MANFSRFLFRFKTTLAISLGLGITSTIAEAVCEDMNTGLAIGLYLCIMGVFAAFVIACCAFLLHCGMQAVELIKS